MAVRPIDGRVERGNQTRRLVLRRTMEIASLEGLEALSLGRLATELKLSKSGVFALFGSKEELQLATVRAASKVYFDHVVQPALAAPPGLPRMWALCEAWIAYSSERTFPGGCFFHKVITEFNSRPGPVRDSIRVAHESWRNFVRETLEEARRMGDIAPGEDVERLTFEVTALLEAANAESLLWDSAHPYDQAREAIRCRLRSITSVEPAFLRAGA